MGLFKKKPDPISDRSKALSAQIAALEAQIKKLDHKLQQEEVHPGPDSPAALRSSAPAPKRAAAHREPIFEPVDRRPLEAPPEEEHTLDHFNDLGVRKYDLAAVWKRWRNQFRGPPASNPKLVTYLAAGSIKGLRPLRYEKRVARNRFIALFLILVCLLWGIIAVFVHNR
jgi:hypothetical protein